jgi:hypothetical protein
MLMFQAVNEESSCSIMHIRKWLRVLIDRSLVLGTVDRPSVHDLVLDFAVAQQSKEQLQLRHRAIVQAFRASRPADAHGRRKFDRTQKQDLMANYVCNEVEYHVSLGWEEDATRDVLATREWLGDVPQDAIVVAAARVLGADRVSTLAAAAEASKEWWTVARYWAALQMSSKSHNFTGGLEPTINALKAMDKMSKIALSQPDKEDFHLGLVAVLASTWDATGDLARRPGLVKHVLSTGAAPRDPASIALIRLVSDIMPCVMGPNIKKAKEIMLDLLEFLVRSADSDPDPLMRSKCQAAMWNFAQLVSVMWDAEFSWDAAYGADGAICIAAMDAYDYDTIHPWLNRTLSGDWLTVFAGPCLPLVIHWGDMARVDEMLDRLFLSMQLMSQESDSETEKANLLCIAPFWSVMIWSCRLSTARSDAVANFMRSNGLSWAEIDNTMKECAEDFSPLRPLGDRSQEQYIHSGEAFWYPTKCGLILMASDLRVSEAEILRALPSPQEIVAGVVMQCPGGGHMHAVTHTSHTLMNSFLSCAYVCEKYVWHEKALSYSLAGLVPDLDQGGTTLALTRVLLLSVQARSLAALGRLDEAGPVFLQAADEAHRSGFHLYEAFALRDLKVSVLDGMGHGNHGAQLLGAALRLLTGPAEMLTTLLDGVDAAEMMASTEPDLSYEIAFRAEDAAHAALRQELVGMKLSALRKRAQAEDVEVEAMEKASDGDNEKRDLVQLILERHTSSGGVHEAAWRAELVGLKLSALRRRAIADGIDSELLDDAADGDDERASLIEAIVDRCSREMSK